MRKVIVHTTPLIALAGIGHLNVLEKSYLHELGTDADVLRGSWRGVKYRQMYFLWQRGWSACNDASISGVK